MPRPASEQRVHSFPSQFSSPHLPFVLFPDNLDEELVVVGNLIDVRDLNQPVLEEHPDLFARCDPELGLAFRLELLPGVVSIRHDNLLNAETIKLPLQNLEEYKLHDLSLRQGRDTGLGGVDNSSYRHIELEERGMPGQEKFERT